MHQTDEPIDTTDAVLKDAEPNAEDTEGHSLYAGEFHQSLARERSRESTSTPPTRPSARTSRRDIAAAFASA